METWLAGIAAAAMLVLALVRIKVFISMSYRRRKDDDCLAINVYIFRRIMLYNLEVPVVRMGEQGGIPWLEAEINTPRGNTKTHAGAEQRFARKTWEVYRHHRRHWRHLVRQISYYVRIYRRVMRKLLAAVTCEKLSWHTRLGTDDAALTAIATGIVWFLKSQTYLYMQRRLGGVPRPLFRVIPLYGTTGVEVELECIFSIRLGNVINALASVIQFQGKGVNRQWVNTQSRV